LEESKEIKVLKASLEFMSTQVAQGKVTPEEIEIAIEQVRTTRGLNDGRVPTSEFIEAMLRSSLQLAYELMEVTAQLPNWNKKRVIDLTTDLSRALIAGRFTIFDVGRVCRVSAKDLEANLAESVTA
jgi:hypothetical protein